MKQFHEFAHVKNENGEIVGFFIGSLDWNKAKEIEEVKYAREYWKID